MPENGRVGNADVQAEKPEENTHGCAPEG